MEILTRVFYATAATYFFSYLFNIRKEHRFDTAMGGALAQLSYELFTLWFHNTYLAMFIAAILFASYAEVMARIKCTPVTTFIIASLIPLVPGKPIYDAMVCIVQNDLTGALDMGLRALGYAGLLALGIMIVATFARAFLHKKR